MAIFYFSKMAAVRHLGFVVWVFDHPRRVLGGLYHCAKFGLNQCSGFDDMQVFSILRLWLENAYSRPFLGGFWGTFPQKCHSSS